MLIISQENQGIKGYHGTVGAPTNMVDSFLNPLFIGDQVIVSNQSEYEKANKFLGTEYGLDFVIEENPDIANWTSKHQQFVNGIASIWDNHAFDILRSSNPNWFISPEDREEDEEEEYWDELYQFMGGWIVHKVKDYKDLVVGEKIGYLHIQEVPDME